MSWQRAPRTSDSRNYYEDRYRYGKDSYSDDRHGKDRYCDDWYYLDVIHYLPVSLEELYKGTSKIVSFKRDRMCSKCKGTGRSSKDRRNWCQKCEGDKVVEKAKTLVVHVTKGMKNRQRIDQRAMIACDKCDEWYHFGCVKLRSAPKVYICPACEPLAETLSTVVDCERCTDAKFVEPKTPSPKHTKSRVKPNKDELVTQKMVASTDDGNVLRCSSGIERLWWRNRKPFRRVAKRRAELDSLSLFSRFQQ